MEMNEAAQLAAVQRAYAKAADGYADHAEVGNILFQRMLQRLDTLAIKPQRILDLGCGLASNHAALKKRPGTTDVIGVDVSHDMLCAAVSTDRSWLPGRRKKVLVADAALLPLADNSVNLVLCNQVLPWCSQPARVFNEIYRVLAPGCAVFWSSVGPDTLREYRQCWQHIDDAEHVFGLLDMHDLGDDMLAAGFDAPVMDRENLTIKYPSMRALVRELRGSGAVNVAPGRRRGLMSPAASEKLLNATPGPVEITLELVQGHGWKPDSDAGKGRNNNPSGEFTFSLEQMRKSIKGS